MDHIRIGTLLNGSDAARLLPKLAADGFESFGVTFWQTTGDTDIPELGRKLSDLAAETGTVISCVTVFGNALTGEGNNADTLASWERLIDNAKLFGADLVTGFTGRVTGKPIPDSIPVFKRVFGELARRAADNGVRLAFENCDMGGDWNAGDWNIAHNPKAWELMFDAVPGDTLGLEWEPCHQMVQLIDPIPQLRKWQPRIYHLHGKDATVAWDVIRESGIGGSHPFAWHRTPGFGDSNWTDIITILRQGGYKGTIDIEGFHDPVYRGELEYTGQLHGLRYLKSCRGGDFVPSPF